MTDTVVNGDGQSVSTSPSIPVSSPSPSSERTFSQSEVNDLVGRTKAEAVERYERRQASQNQSQNVSDHEPRYLGQQVQAQQQYSNAPLSQDEIRRLAAEEFQKSRNEWIQESQRSAHEQQAQRIASEFFGKMDAGKGKYDDFDKVVNEVDFSEIPHVVQLANMVDNTADVVYELSKNPSKIGSLQNLIQTSPKLAALEMRRLSDSIKNNETAKNFKSPNEPLSQMKPSNAGMDDRSALSVSDYKKRYRG